MEVGGGGRGRASRTSQILLYLMGLSGRKKEEFGPQGSVIAEKEVSRAASDRESYINGGERESGARGWGKQHWGSSTKKSSEDWKRRGALRERPKDASAHLIIPL